LVRTLNHAFEASDKVDDNNDKFEKSNNEDVKTTYDVDAVPWAKIQ
jgi:hypothetical protein